MKIQKLNIRGTEMNKIHFPEIEPYLEEKGMDVMTAFDLLADENEFIYVSNGFVSGLKTNENDVGEWHHFFKKGSDNCFEAGKMKFN